MHSASAPRALQHFWFISSANSEIESAQFIAKIERQPCPQEQEVGWGDASGFSETSADSQSSFHTSDVDTSSCDSDSAAKRKRTKKRIPFPKKSEKRDKKNRELWEVAHKIITVDKHMKNQRGVMNSTQMDAFLASQSYIKSVDEYNHYASVVKKDDWRADSKGRAAKKQ